MSERYRGYLDTCMPSEEMRDYLKTIDYLSEWQIYNMILWAPVSIYTKKSEFEKLLRDAELHKDSELFNEAKKGLRNVEYALKCLDMEGIFLVNYMVYKDNEHDSSVSEEYVFDNFDKVQTFIRKYCEECEFTTDDLNWFEVIKWVKNPDGDYKEYCYYVIAREDIVFFSVDKESGIPDDCHEFGNIMGDLNLPVPFKAGDILEVDGFPFGPRFRTLVLSVGDNWDCCCVQALALNEDGKWEMGAFKHAMVSYRYSPKFAYLYTARKYAGELPDDERILGRIKEYIDGDVFKGDVYHSILFGGCYTEAELDDRIDILKGLNSRLGYLNPLISGRS